MLKFRTVNIIGLLILVSLVSYSYRYAPVPWWVYAILVWAYVSIVFWGCKVIALSFFMPVACKKETNEKIIALSFDDGPHPIHTPRILNTLKENDVQAAFFCIGRNIEGNEAILQRMSDEGNLIGNHSYSHHFWFDMFPTAKMLADMQMTDTAVEKATGLKPVLFRPPYGVTNPNLKKAIIKGGYTPIGWSLRSYDTMAKEEHALLNKITGKLKPGDVILMHDSLPITAEILPYLIKEIKNKGYKIVRLDSLLNVKAYA